MWTSDLVQLALGRIGTSASQIRKCGPGSHGNKMSYQSRNIPKSPWPPLRHNGDGAVFDLEEVTAVPNYATVLGVLADWDWQTSCFEM